MCIWNTKTGYLQEYWNRNENTSWVCWELWWSWSQTAAGRKELGQRSSVYPGCTRLPLKELFSSVGGDTAVTVFALIGSSFYFICVFSPCATWNPRFTPWTWSRSYKWLVSSGWLCFRNWAACMTLCTEPTTKSWRWSSQAAGCWGRISEWLFMGRYVLLGLFIQERDFSFRRNVTFRVIYQLHWQLIE